MVTFPAPTFVETDVYAIRISRQFLEDYFARDKDGHRVTMELGKPDQDGFYCPTFTVWYDDTMPDQPATS